MKTIAVIEKNKCYFDQMEEFALPLLYREHTIEERKILKEKLNDYIWSVIKPYITFIEITKDQDLMTVICENLIKCFPEKNADEFYYHTEGSYSSPKRFVELLYVQPFRKKNDQNNDQNNDSINNVGCLFSLKHTVIQNNCVILVNKYNLSAKYFTEIDNTTQRDILRIMRRRYFFTAILIKNNSFIKYYYQDPRYLIQQVFNLKESDPIQKLSFTHLKYNLVYYFQQNNNQYLNRIATRINGTYVVHGDVLILHELEDKIYGNLSMHEIKRLNVLSYGRLYDRQLKNDELYTLPETTVDQNGNEQIEKKIPLWSKYIVIEKRMIDWKKNKNKCINCEKQMTHPITCQYCFRIKYCSENCIKEFSSYHNEECLRIKS